MHLNDGELSLFLADVSKHCIY